MLLQGAAVAGSHKQSAEKNQGQAAIETYSPTQSQREADGLFSAIQAEQSDVVKLTKSIEDQAKAEHEKNRTDDTALPLLSRLTPLRVQQGLLIVGVFYTFFAGWQLIQIRRQANIAQRTLDVVERPYLSFQIKAVSLENARMGYQRLKVDYSLVNSGRTPARISDHNSVLCRTSSKAQPQAAPYDPSAAQRVTRQTIGADRQHEASIWLEIPSGEQSAIFLGVEGTEAFVHLFMYADYKDGLGTPHSSYLSGIVTPERAAKGGWDLRIAFPRSHQCKEDT
ncbi:MAG: hypothetical protein WB650_05490 [Candidatus Binatus sp.]